MIRRDTEDGMTVTIEAFQTTEARAEIHWHSSEPYKAHSFRALVKAGLSV